MSGNSSRLRAVQFVGLLAAVLGVVGYVVFGWRFDDSGGTLPFLLGIFFAIVAVGWTVYQRW